MGVSGLYNTCLSLEECSHSIDLFLAKLGLVDFQLHENDGSCVTVVQKLTTEP